MIVQKIVKEIPDAYTLAFKYFSILSVVNDMNMVKRDVQLLSYAISENALISDIKEDFVEKFNSSMPTVGNIISKLYKLKVLEKKKREVSINKAHLLDFNNDLMLALKFLHKK